METYRVFYAKQPTNIDTNPPPTVADLAQTHVLVREFEAPSLGAVYDQMQAERWRPYAEVDALIERLNLTHTSLSINDVVQAPDGQYHECMSWGRRML